MPRIKTPCTVTFINTLLQFEHPRKTGFKTECIKGCTTIKHAISAGLNKANITLGYTNSTPSFAFQCPCGTGEPHPATIGDGFWICCLDEEFGDEFLPNQLIWLEDATPEAQAGI